MKMVGLNCQAMLKVHLLAS